MFVALLFLILSNYEEVRGIIGTYSADMEIGKEINRAKTTIMSASYMGRFTSHVLLLDGAV